MNSSTMIPWDDCERISNVPDVHEALTAFSHDSTGDNATCLVREVLYAVEGGEVTDAARYRFLEDQCSRGEYRGIISREAIDAAIKAQKGLT